MSTYMRSCLGQDDFELFPSELYQIPSSDPFSGQSADVSWSGYGLPSNVTLEPFPYPQRAPVSDGGWWSGISKVLVPLSTAAANIIRATTGQAPPPGSMYNPATGQYVVPPSTNWLIPALLLGGGAILLLRTRR
jgi:hypothetical protein